MSEARYSRGKCVEFGRTMAKSVYDQLAEERDYGANEAVESIAKRAVGRAILENPNHEDIVFSDATQGLLSEIDRETLHG